MKKIISMVLSFILILGCSTTAFAAETHNYDTENLTGKSSKPVEEWNQLCSGS